MLHLGIEGFLEDLGVANVVDLQFRMAVIGGRHPDAAQPEKLLEQGTAPLEAAVRTGFSDQSHFTNYFSRFTGLAPGVYRDMFREKKKEEKQDGK